MLRLGEWRCKMEEQVRSWYAKWIRPHISNELNRQRLKLVWFVWGYWRLMTLNSLSFIERLNLLVRFIRIDWNVLHGHRPCEIVSVCKALAERFGAPHEVMIEAGCWQGGSSAKWSILCKRLGYQLHIFDSFEGVEPLTPEAKASSYDFSGEYAATEGLLRSNLARYGEASVCSVHKGWFAETLALRPVQSPVRVVYIDCDLAKGTDEVLRGVVSRLVEDGWLFSQDFHIPAVQTLLCSPATWQRLGRPVPHVTRLCGNLAAVKF